MQEHAEVSEMYGGKYALAAALPALGIAPERARDAALPPAAVARPDVRRRTRLVAAASRDRMLATAAVGGGAAHRAVLERLDPGNERVRAIHAVLL